MRSPGLRRFAGLASALHLPVSRLLRRRISTAPPLGARLPRSLAGITRLLLATRRSPGASQSLSLLNMEWWMVPESRSSTISREWSRRYRRDHSRLMVLDRDSGTIHHSMFNKLSDWLAI